MAEERKVIETIRLHDWSPKGSVVELIEELTGFIAKIPEEFRSEAELDEFDGDWDISYARSMTPEEIAKQEEQQRASALDEVRRIERNLADARRKAGLE